MKLGPSTLLSLLFFLPNAPQGPYLPDEHTLLLAHFDESISADYSRGFPFAMVVPNPHGYRLERGRFGKALRIFEGCRLIYKGDDGNINVAQGTIEFWLKPDWDGTDESLRPFMSIRVGENNYINLNKAGKAPYGKLGGGICGPDETKKEGFTYYRFKYDCSHWKRGEWHHYALSWRKGELHFYVDGEEVDSSYEVVPPVGLPAVIELHGFGGLLDELRISDIPRKPFSQGKAVSREGRKRWGLRLIPQPAPAPIWSLLLDDLDGDGEQEFVLGGMDHCLYLKKGEALLWKRDLQGIAYDLSCGDVDGDGKKEIGACSFDDEGRFYLLRNDGTLIGKFGVGLPFMGSAISDLDNDGKAEIVLGGGDAKLYVLDPALRVKWSKEMGRRIIGLKVDDLDGDGKKEIVIATLWGGISCLDGAGRRLWTSRACGATVGNVVVADLDGDGRKEIIAGGIHPPVSIGVIDHRGRTVWVRERCGFWGWGSRPLGVADLVAESGKEIAAFDQVRGTFHLLSSKGKLLKACQDVLPPFNLAPSPDGRTLWASSLGCRDERIYRLEVKESGVDRFVKLSDKTPLQERAEALYRWARAHPLRRIEFKRRPTRKFHILVNFGADPERIVRYYHEFLKPLNGQHIEFQVFVEVGRKPRKERLLQIAEACERNKVPIRFWIAHGCRPWIDIDTAEEILERAPNYCRGFNVGENFAGRGFTDPKWQKFTLFLEQLLRVCKEHGVTLIMEEMFDSWVFIPVDKITFGRLFKPGYESVLVPMIRTNNAHCTELQMGAILGLWQAGLIREWGISSQNWNWTWDQQLFMPALCPDDLVLRMDIVAASLGATYFHVEGYFQPFYEYGPEGLIIHPRAKRHRALLYELMRKNLILPASFDQLVNLSPVAFRVIRGRKRDYTYNWYRGGQRAKGVFDFRFCMQTTSDYYAPSYLYGERHYFENIIPSTPYGFIRIFPETVETSGLKDVRDWVVTDGTNVFKGKKPLPASQAREFIRRKFEKGLSTLPFRSKGVFLSAQKWGDDDYLLYLVDPGYLRPLGVKAEVSVNLRGKTPLVEDWLTNETLEVRGGKFSVSIPPASFRILRVRAK